MSLVVWKIEPSRSRRCADLAGVDQVAVVHDPERPQRGLDHDRLRVVDHAVAGGRVAGVSDRARARQALQGRGAEDVGHVAHAALDVEPLAVPRHDAGALLPAVLQRIEPEVGEVRRLARAVDAEDAAHVRCLARSSRSLRCCARQTAHCSIQRPRQRLAPRGLRVLHVETLRSHPTSSVSPPTTPISRAGTPISAASASTDRASCGATAITARAWLSEKSDERIAVELERARRDRARRSLRRAPPAARPRRRRARCAGGRRARRSRSRSPSRASASRSTAGGRPCSMP